MKIDHNITLTMNQNAKNVELLNLHDLIQSCNLNVRYFNIQPALHLSNYDALNIKYLVKLNNQSLNMEVDVIPTETYPDEQPFCIVNEPDLQSLILKDKLIPPHVHADLNYRGVICSYVRSWNNKSSLARYFVNGILPWSYNFFGWLLTIDTPHPHTSWENWR